LTRGTDPTGRYWRILSPRWASKPLSGEGAARHGGRWNRPGVAALYLSEQIESAFAEYQQELGVRPGTFVAYDIAGGMIADLGDPAVLDDLGVEPAALAEPWKQTAFVRGGTPGTWVIADRLLGEVDGVRSPSTQYAGGFNLTLWRWNEAGGPAVRFHDPREELAPRR
jgi:RES domain-containing protein